MKIKREREEDEDEGRDIYGVSDEEWSPKRAKSAEENSDEEEPAEDSEMEEEPAMAKVDDRTWGFCAAKNKTGKRKGTTCGRTPLS